MWGTSESSECTNDTQNHCPLNSEVKQTQWKLTTRSFFIILFYYNRNISFNSYCLLYRSSGWYWRLGFKLISASEPLCSERGRVSPHFDFHGTCDKAIHVSQNSHEHFQVLSLRAGPVYCFGDSGQMDEVHITHACDCTVVWKCLLFAETMVHYSVQVDIELMLCLN